MAPSVLKRAKRRASIYRLFATIILLTIPPALALAQDKLPGASELAAQLSKHQHMPAIVMMSLPGCPVCEIVRREQLVPLLTDSAYQDIGVFEIQMTDQNTTLPLMGEHRPVGHSGPLTPKQLAKHRNIRLSPTVIFINRNKVLAEPLVGYPSRDFYWSYLSERIREARLYSADN